MSVILVLGLISAVVLAVALTAVLVTILLFLARIRRVLIEIQPPLRAAAGDARRIAERLERLKQGCSAAAKELLTVEGRFGIPAPPSDRMQGPPARGRDR